MRAAVAAFALLALLGSGCRAVTDGANDPGGSNGGNKPPAGSNGNGDGGSKPSLPADDDDRLTSLSQQLLSGSIGKAVLEVDTTGPALTGPARDGLRAALEQHGNKSVTFATQGSAPEQDVYTADDLRRISAQTRDTASNTNRMSVHVLVLEGRFEEDGVLGVAFEATSFAIFPDQIERGVLASLNFSRFEHAVVVHELGHLFGLVNLTGKGAFHEDPQHRGHSANKSSVMYWAVEDVSVGNVFRGGPPTDFDADDIEEMSRIRG